MVSGVTMVIKMHTFIDHFRGNIFSSQYRLLIFLNGEQYDGISSTIDM